MTKPIIAAFDFDGTLTDRDTLLPFLYYVSGRKKTIKALLELTPEFFCYLVGSVSRQKVKEQILSKVIGLESQKAMQKKGTEFAEKIIPTLLKPGMLKRLLWHQSQGHHCILISAAVDLYIQPWGQIMGFQTIISSHCEVNTQGQLTGNLIGLNCWGKEKVRRLTEIIGPRDRYELYVYGDSLGDTELLEMADHAFYRYEGDK